jgi:hypothetical protein
VGGSVFEHAVLLHDVVRNVLVVAAVHAVTTVATVAVSCETHHDVSII